MNTITTQAVQRFAIFLALAIAGFLSTLLFTGCQRPEDKVETAKEKLAEAKQDLKEASRDARADWQEAWLTVKRDYDKEVAINERRIIDLRKEVATIDMRYRSTYNIRIDDLERRNTELRERLNHYNNQGDQQWEEFKTGLKREMDDLQSSLKNITIKNG